MQRRPAVKTIPTPKKIKIPLRGSLVFLKKLTLLASIVVIISAFSSSQSKLATGADANSSLPTFTRVTDTQNRPSAAESIEGSILTSVSIEKTDTFIPSYLIINKISLVSPVESVEGTFGNWQVPDSLPGTPSEKSRVGGDTNISVWGHRATIFKRLGEMQEGDSILVSNSETLRKYKIYEVKVIEPNPSDGVEISPTEDKILTLITCHPLEKFNQRLIIHARLVETK